ncbi:MAG: TRAP transporter small permease [Aquincola tertiaricarbonis]|uniref:TRAP transporter small permease n=1 Tax=Aquincola TaxID=391952 RepID=UPI001E4CC1E5|nr:MULTISPECIES: TRAP transporter small permease [Aquincola]MCR5867902.1 TRAP transporter small permease [Aquincola sp. J276]
MLNRLFGLYCRALEALLVLALATMVLLVFGNVVLRYAFNSGITVSEELSRWLFIWLTFLGAVVALHEHRHLGTDMLLARLGPGGRRACLVAGHLLMLGACGLLLQGSVEQMRINWSVSAPSSGAPMAVVYGAAVVFAASAIPMLVVDMLALMRPGATEDGQPFGMTAEEQA